MLAFFLLSLLLFGFSPILLSANLAIKRGQSLERTTESAQREIEARRQAGFDALPDITGNATSATESFAPAADLPEEAGEVVVTRVDANLNPTTTESGRRRVEVTVSWSGSGSDRGTVTLTTLMTTRPDNRP